MAYDLGTAKGRIELEYEGGREAEKAEDDIEEISREAKKADRHLDKLSNSLRSVFATLGKASVLTVLATSLTNGAVAAGAMAVQVLGMVPALASISSLAAGLPALFIAGVASVNVLKLAFVGMSDVVKALVDDDMGKFNEALKELSPNARKFAVGLKEIFPALKQIQQGIQDAFFSTDLQAWLPTLLSRAQALRPALQGLAQDFGKMGQQILAFSVSQGALDLVSGTLNQMRTSLQALLPTVRPILDGLTAVGKVGLGLFPRMTDTVVRLATSFGQWMQQIAASGQLQEWINTALATLRTLGVIIANVGGIFSTVFNIAGETGGGLLGTLALITDQFRLFVQSAEGSEAIRGLFTGLIETAKQLSPIFTTLAGIVGGTLGPALADLAQGVGPSLLAVVQGLRPAIEALAPGLVELGTALGQGLAELAPALAPVGQALGAVAKAVAPLLVPLGKLIALMATQLANGITVLMAEIGPLIGVLSQGLAGALQGLVPVMGHFANVLPIAAQFGAELARAFAPLVPAMIQFGEALGQAIVPLLPKLVEVAQIVAPAFVELAGVLGQSMADALLQLIPLLPPLIQSMITLAVPAAKLVAFFLRLMAVSIQVSSAFSKFTFFVIGLIGKIDDLARSVGSALTSAFRAVVTAVTTAFNAVVNFFAQLPNRIMNFLTSLPARMKALFTAAFDAVFFAIGFGIGRALKLTLEFPGKVVGALRALRGLLVSTVTAAWNAGVSAVTNGINRAIAIARSLPGRIGSAISAIRTTVPNLIRGAFTAAVSAVSSGISAISSRAQAIPGVFRNLAGALFSAGANMIRGAINGVLSAVGGLVDAARRAAQRAVDGFKAALKIGSPSKVLFEIGAFTTQGFTEGILSLLKKSVAAAKQVATRTIGVVANVVSQPVDVRSLPDWRPPSLPGEGVATASGISIQNNVTALPGMNAAEVAAFATRKMVSALGTGGTSLPVPLPSAGG